MNDSKQIVRNAFINHLTETPSLRRKSKTRKFERIMAFASKQDYRMLDSYLEKADDNVCNEISRVLHALKEIGCEDGSIISSAMRIALFSSKSAWLKKVSMETAIGLFTLGVDDINSNTEKYADIEFNANDLKWIADNSNNNYQNRKIMRLIHNIRHLSDLSELDSYMVMRAGSEDDVDGILNILACSGNDGTLRSHITVSDAMLPALRDNTIMTFVMDGIPMTDAVDMFAYVPTADDYDRARVMVDNGIVLNNRNGSFYNTDGTYITNSGLLMLSWMVKAMGYYNDYRTAAAVIQIAYYVAMIADIDSRSLDPFFLHMTASQCTGISQLAAVMAVSEHIRDMKTNDYPEEFVVENFKILATQKDEELNSMYTIDNNFEGIFDF